MKKYLIMGLMVLLIVSVLAGGIASASLVFRFGHNQRVGSPQDKGIMYFKERVEEISNGEMKVEVFPAMQLGTMREQAEATQMGFLNMTQQPISVMTPFVKELELLDLAYLFPDEDALWKVLDGKVGREFLDLLENKGMTGLGYWACGFKNFTANKKITKPADLKGMKMRVMPANILIETYKAWGANPVPIEFGELYNALQQGVVDGQENPLQTITMINLQEVQDYVIKSEHGYLAYIVFANKNWFDGLTKKQQDIIRQAEKEAREYERQLIDEETRQYIQTILDSGTEIVELTNEQKKAFRDRVLPVHQQFADTPARKALLQKIYDAVEGNQ